MCVSQQRFTSCLLSSARSGFSSSSLLVRCFLVVRRLLVLSLVCRRSSSSRSCSSCSFWCRSLCESSSCEKASDQSSDQFVHFVNPQLELINQMTRLGRVMSVNVPSTFRLTATAQKTLLCLSASGLVAKPLERFAARPLRLNARRLGWHLRRITRESVTRLTRFFTISGFLCAIADKANSEGQTSRVQVQEILCKYNRLHFFEIACGLCVGCA